MFALDCRRKRKDGGFRAFWYKIANRCARSRIKWLNKQMRADFRSTVDQWQRPTSSFSSCSSCSGCTVNMEREEDTAKPLKQKQNPAKQQRPQPLFTTFVLILNWNSTANHTCLYNILTCWSWPYLQVLLHFRLLLLICPPTLLVNIFIGILFLFPGVVACFLSQSEEVHSATTLEVNQASGGQLWLWVDVRWHV